MCIQTCIFQRLSMHETKKKRFFKNRICNSRFMFRGLKTWIFRDYFFWSVCFLFLFFGVVFVFPEQVLVGKFDMIQGRTLFRSVFLEKAKNSSVFCFVLFCFLKPDLNSFGHQYIWVPSGGKLLKTAATLQWV